MLRVIWVCLGVWLVACSGEAPEPAPAPAPIVQKQEEKPVDPCEKSSTARLLSWDLS